jgi:hypothetical protein
VYDAKMWMRTELFGDLHRMGHTGVAIECMTLPKTNLFDAKFEQVVLHVQRALDLPITGKVDADLWEVLEGL